MRDSDPKWATSALRRCSPNPGTASNAEAVIRSQIHPGAKRCYQKGLENDPSQSGRIVILIVIVRLGRYGLTHVRGSSRIHRHSIASRHFAEA